MTVARSPMRPEPPPLTVRLPLCGVCGDEVCTDDGALFYCPDCAVSWTAADGDGVWDSPDAEQCGSVDGRWLPGGRYSTRTSDPSIRRCILHSDHADKHAHIDEAADLCFRWEDDGTATPEQLTAARKDTA